MRRTQREEQQIFFTQAPVDYITGGTPVERADTVVYSGDYYPLEGANPDPRYTIGATPTNVGYANDRYQTTWNTRAGRAYGIYEELRELNAEREARTIREMEEYMAQEREYERTIEEAVALRERTIGERARPVVNGVTLVSEREYAQMEREGRLDPNEMYYTYPDTDDGLTVAWTERHPKIVKITYFID